MKPLQGRSALVTGSTSGIGRGIASHLAELGARVAITGRDRERGEETVSAIEVDGGEARFFSADLSAAGDCVALAREAGAWGDGLDILVNNAADLSRGNIEFTETELFDRILAVNLRAPFVLTREVVPQMKRKGGGAVVNIGSVNAYIGEPKLCAYSASKGGLMTLTRNAASYLGQYRIRVNQINVGWTLTDGERRVKQLEGKGEDWLEEAEASRPFGRLYEPRDIALACAWFVLPSGECVSGTVMDLEQFPVGAPPNW